MNSLTAAETCPQIIRRRRCRLLLSLAALILLQLGVLTYWGFQKQGFHIDEIYSFQNCNGLYEAFLHDEPGYSDTWHSTEYYAGSLYVREDRRFSYDTVLANVNNDPSHVPLFHLFLHTSCSLFPGIFSKWLGIVPNMLYFVVTQIFLFLCASWFFKGKEKWFAFLPCILWGFSAGAASMVIYVRMYSMLAMWTMGAVYFHLKLLSEKKSAKNLLFAGLFSFLCLMTHYYSALFLFFLAACFVFYRLFLRQWKAAALYAGSMLGAFALMIALWPTALTRGLIGSDRGNEALANLKSLSVSLFAHRLSAYLTILGRAFFYTWTKELSLLLVLLLLACIGKAIYDKTHRPGRNAETRADPNRPADETRSGSVLPRRRPAFFFLAISVAACAAVIAQIAPYYNLRYVSFLLPLAALCFVLLTRWMFRRLFANAAVFPAALLILFAAVTILSYRGGSILYLYPESETYGALMEAHPCGAAVCFYEDCWETADEVTQFLHYPRIYCTREENIASLGSILDEIGYGGDLMVYLDRDTDQYAAVAEILKETDLTKYERLYSDNYFTAYCFSP
ncbi:ArnT family glycosyltransferase [Papillibacter cinnamivorans]|uniref:Dolichyl-phosphate-mannose-protein mannosyltransferase n=1 Tax=Papillibacter cinnamivorans DSM 12816 TaxID=1122930 RepID=A0A1W2A044_9FIRM|nr:hypothetical protein [Papillibacter cinnamivorans]SMC54010.1 Dolichyl-phosphate-mannose-protein mannosyltransferase [Papillibacter cinnamivorans DSM 12816]